MKSLYYPGSSNWFTALCLTCFFSLTLATSHAQVTIQGTASWNSGQTCNDCCEGSCTDGDRGDYCDDIEWTSNGPGTQVYCGSRTVTVEGDVWDSDGLLCGPLFDCNAIESRSVTISPASLNPASQIFEVGVNGSNCWRNLYFDVWTTGSFPGNASVGGQSNTSICSAINGANNHDAADWVNNHTMDCNGTAWYRYQLTVAGRQFLRFSGVKESGTITAWTSVTEVRFSATGNCSSTCNLSDGGGGGDFEIKSPQPGYYYVKIEDQGVGSIQLFDIDTDLGPNKIPFDDICNASLINNNVTLGYNSGLIAGTNVNATDEDFCGVDEPYENDNRTVWYKFQTGATIGSQLSIYVENRGAGDNMTPDIAVFKGPSSISCATQYNFSTLTHVGNDDGDFGLLDNDAEVIITTCDNKYTPNTWYYVQIDDEGNTLGVGYDDGNFNIRVRDLNIIEVADVCASATTLGTGTLTLGGTIGNSGAAYSNLCAGNAGEGAYPAGCGFGIQHGVWFTFVTAANVSGHVDVRGFNTGGDDIDVQLTVFEGATCGAMTEIDCDYDPTILFCADGLCDEDMFDVCVQPSTRYYILVDGGGLTAALEQGVFGLTVTDISGEPGNDAPCNATPMATQAFNTYNTTFLNNQSNVNGTNCNEPDPGWFSNGNDHVVWYKVNLPGRGIVIDANNLAGDNIDVQLALYEANPNCSNLTYKDREWDPGWPVACIGGLCDEDFVASTCIDPDKEYYLAVDGGDDPIGFTGYTEGNFSLRAYFNREGGLNPCLYNATTNKYGAPRIGTGAVPTGGSVTLLNNSNFCGLDDAAMTAGGWPLPSWGCDEAVWYVFRPPASGSVRIDAYSDPVIGPALGFASGDAIDLQLAVYESSNTSCSPPSWSIVSSESNSIISGGFDEYLIANCLDPSKDYYLLVDGSGLNTVGLFELEITDYGISTPNDLVCNAIDIVAAQTPALQTQWATCNTNVTLTLPGQNNYCADNINEPIPSGWSGQTSNMVWYKFTAPPSGGVWVELNTVTSNPLDPEYINGKIAIYDVDAATLASCGATGGFTEIASDYDVDVPPVSTGEDLYDNILGFNDKFVQCLEPGKTYYIAVDGQSVALGPEWNKGEFTLSIESSPRDAPGPNDEICDAAVYGALGDPTGGSVSTTSLRPRGGIYSCMSAENNFCMDASGDPPLPGFGLWGLDQTAWYTFVAPSTGAVRIDATNVNCGGGSDDIDLQLAVVESEDGTCTGNLNVIAADYDPGAPVLCAGGLCDETITVNCLDPGVTYWLIVDGGGVLDYVQGCFEVEITEVVPTETPPYNDDICDAFQTTPFSGPWTHSRDTNRCASLEFGIPEPSTFTRDHTVWYKFTTPGGAGPYAVSIDVTSDWPWPFGDAMDPQIAVYESSNGTCSGTITEKSSDYSIFNLPFIETYEVHCLEPSKQYWVMIDGSGINSQGYFDITLESIAPNPIAVNNEICAVVNAATGDLGTLGAAGGSTLGGFGGGDPLWNNFCSDVAAGEPDPAAFDLDQTVWFKFKTPLIAGANDGVSVSIELDSDLSYGDLIDLQLAVYQPDAAGCGANLFEIESAYDPVLNLFDEDLDLCLKEDSEYWIQVDGSALNTQGYFKLRITNNGSTLRPANDNFCNAQPLTVGLWRNGDDNNCATLEIGEPGAGSDQQRTVWYSFVAPASGRVEIRTVDADGALSGIDPELHLYEFNGSCTAGVFTGTFTELGSAYFPTIGVTNPDDVLDYECLFPGTTYYVQVDGTTVGGPEGVFNIRVSDLGYTAPANDACANAINLNVNTESCQYSSGTWSTRNYGEATRSLPDVSGCGSNCGDTWYRFTMPATGFAKIEGNDELGILGVNNSALAIIAYSGTCGSLTYLDCDIGGFTDDADFSVSGTPGSTIFLQVFSDNQNSDDNEDFQICVSERCSADDCPDAIAVGDMTFGQEYCWDVRDATGEVVSGGEDGYSVCGTANDPNKSVYFKFATDDFCWGYNITIKTTDLSEFGSCTAGNAPSSELSMGVFKDNDGTYCDNTFGELLDCETFNDCTYPSGVNKTITYYVGASGDSIRKNSEYVIQLQAEDLFPFITSDDVIDGTIEVSKICDGRTWAYAPLGVTSSNGYCDEGNGWRHYYNDNGTPLDVNDDILIFSVWLNGNVFDGVAEITVLNDYTEKIDPLAAGTWTMRRYWDFDITSGSIDPNFPVGVRFYYLDAEKQEIITAAQAFAAAATPALQYEPFEWFKTLDGYKFSPNLVHPRYIEHRGWSETGQFTPNIFADTPDGPGDAAQDHDEDVRNVFCNGVQYVEMQGLTGFSGGTGAAGASDASQSPLPVELISFVGWNEGDVNKLEWITSAEVNNELFVVERSVDAVDFLEIGSLPGNGTTTEEHTYNFTDVTPVDGWNYYRLKQIDFDGTTEYSSVIAVEVEGNEVRTAIVKVHPNPAFEEINLQIQSAAKTEFNMIVMDITGRIVYNEDVDADAGLNAPLAIDISEYGSGVYLINMIDKRSGERFETKFVKR